MQSTISLNSVIKVAQKQASVNVGNEVAILNLRSGVYYSLNPTGAHIWSLIQSPKKVNEIRDALSREYDSDSPQLEEDLLALLRDLADYGLIEITE